MVAIQPGRNPSPAASLDDHGSAHQRPRARGMPSVDTVRPSSTERGVRHEVVTSEVAAEGTSQPSRTLTIEGNIDSTPLPNELPWPCWSTGRLGRDTGGEDGDWIAMEFIEHQTAIEADPVADLTLN